MPDYVLLLFDRDDAVINADTLSASSRAEAEATASQQLKGSEEAMRFEIWADGEMIASGT